MAVKYTKELLERLVAESRSYLEVLRRLGANGISSASYTHLRRKITSYGIKTDHFLGMAWAKGVSKRSKLSPDQVLVVLTGHGRIATRRLRRALVETGVPYICAKCGLGPLWDGESMTLEIDHIDENWRDCRIHNLQFLCPNCHSQKGRTRVTTCSCGKVIPRKSKHCKCCHMKYVSTLPRRHHTKIVWPDNESLHKMVWKYPALKVAEILGVSSVMVKKHCAKRGIATPPVGYWSKLRSKLGPIH